VATERVESLTKQQFKRLRLYFAQMPPENAFAIDGVEETARDEGMVLLEVRDSLNRVLETAVSYHITDLETEPVTLEEVFLAYYGD
jgi:ABC-2 type transport system ATP-binding protein